MLEHYKSADGKTQAMFGLMEVLKYSYRLYFISLCIVSFVFWKRGVKRNESPKLKYLVLIICILSIMSIFTPIWRLYI